ncbi:MAG: hypothetical protein QOI11_509 [Candidatus Eremiobacteraeota bacterium]|jgi:uncharacterized protein YndB with AHSA1/START domain|nr:hypothetical protein [Candidatus Eremiobacteraeota bacterium]
MNLPFRQVYEVYIRTTPEKLWQALTDGALTKQYFFGGTLNGGPLAAGSPMTYLDGEGNALTGGEVLEIEAPRRLVQTWRATWQGDERDPDSRVTYEITPLGASCKLSVTHEHVSAEGETAKGTAGGWPIVLSGLKTLLETGTPLEIAMPEEAATT